nr:RNA-directed DNA polymerase, eukaryota, reverse transcriptase zinc-binding domain protein [Tanacetum cinerariifolium]
MKYPPGFTPSCDNDFHIAVEKQEDGHSQIMKDDKTFFGESNTDHSNNKKDDLQDKGESMCSGHFKRMDVPRTGGLGQKTKKDWVKELCINNKVNFLSLQETKIEEMQLFNIKACWGNFNFDHTYSPSVGASGGILCVWDPKIFSKNNHTISDYFIMVRGVWIPSGKKMLIISIYAPQELSEKRMLWDYMEAVINNWNGDVVIMGDLIEVRYQVERYGSVFNNQGAEAFNSFIDNAGLEETPLGGCSFTWCHKSATKMSKLDRFLISKHLMNSNPNITAVTLDRYISDHRPILMREAHFDYGPIPFHKKEKDNSSKNNLKKDLHNIDLLLDKGETNLDDIKKRDDIRKALQDFEQLKLKEVAQKAKIKWAIEGDENSKYYHRILNKRRNHLAIRGVMADGTWLEDPNLVKAEFLAHFSTRFEEPKHFNIHLNLEFPYKLNEDQKKDLECDVDRDEIRKAVWECGTDKSPGADGFTFGFFRSIYKIITKILANRLTPLMGDMVNEVQSAFVANRQILDGPFILNELYQCCKKKRKQTMIFKVDFEKAYDSVRWDYLIEVLTKFGFGERWCGWIQNCLRTSRGSILVNGSPTKEFQFQRGLKQGDPLAPFLFILVMESLHISLQRVVDAGMFKGISLGPSLHLSHLFYADDAIFMGQWTRPNLDCIIQVGDLMSRSQSWSEIISSITKRLSKWNMKTLSIGGRLTLIKSVLTTTPIHHLSLFKDPLKVLNKMESIRMRFFNGREMNDRIPIWVKWSDVLTSKEKGGLGVPSLYALNRAILFKWVWRFYSQKSSLWAKVIRGIHGEDGGLYKNTKFNHHSIWLDIIREIKPLKDKGVDLCSFIHKRMGNGIFALECAKNISVADKMLSTNLDNTLRRRPRSGIEQQQYLQHIAYVRDVNLINMNDRWIWSKEGPGEFSVASARRLSDDQRTSTVSTKTRWVTVVLIKINVFAWKMKLDRLPTRFNISRRGIYIDSILCTSCKVTAETVIHVFFSCHLVRDVFRLVSLWWDFSYVELSTYEN